MEAIIKSPVVDDEVVLWTELQRPFIQKKEQAIETTEELMPEVGSKDEGGNSREWQGEYKDNFPAEVKAEAEPQSALESNEAKLRLLEETASKAGYEEGFAKGEAEAKAKYSEALELLNQIIENAKSLELKVLKHAEGLIGEIVFEAVSKIIGDHLSTKEGRLEVVSHAIQGVALSEIVKIKISPQDLAHLRSITDSELANLPCEADTSIELGGCVIELVDGKIDARIEAQFRLFAQSIKEAASHV